jgi:hypothetical protein
MWALPDKGLKRVFSIKCLAGQHNTVADNTLPASFGLGVSALDDKDGHKVKEFSCLLKPKTEINLRHYDSIYNIYYYP